MPKGTPLPPEVHDLIGELYARTGNISETARALNLPFETVRDVLARGENARRRQLNARALEEGLTEGREKLTDVVRSLSRTLAGEIRAGEGLDVTDMGTLGRGVSLAVATLARLDEREEKRRIAPLLRKRIKAETERAAAEAELAKAQAEVARVKAREGASPEDLLKKLTVDELLALLGKIREERARAKEAPDTEKA